MRIQFALLLLLSVLCIAAAEDERHRKFREQHVVGSTVTSCQSIMNDPKREINIKSCKESHKFIVDSGESLKTMCGSSTGEVTRNNKILLCRLKPGSVYPNCVYILGRSFTGSITVTCEGGYPVHYVDATWV
uniref:Ribonuclease A-domain domain-containing protein n=1 Tax=Labrus bergylta TaxID=56723 RepID=A0A3Q3GQQ4_9LABR